MFCGISECRLVNQGRWPGASLRTNIILPWTTTVRFCCGRIIRRGALSNVASKRLAFTQFIILVIASSGLAQVTPERFVIDESKPYVYLKFDHIGSREPANSEESTKGLWLRLVNNCNLPIKISVFDVGTRNAGVGVNFEVVRRAGWIDPESADHQKMPLGYSVDIGMTKRIPPKGDLLLSVPTETVAKDWYIRVRFDFDLPAPKGRYHPYSVVDFTWNEIPERFTQGDPSIPIVHE
jgi:hypothetical protein